MVFFQIQFHLDIGAKSNFVSGKSSKNKFEFEVKVERNKKYLFRVGISNFINRTLSWIRSLYIIICIEDLPF